MRRRLAAVIASTLYWCACGGGSASPTPTSPTTPTSGGARTLSISGTTVLTPGVTSRLSATITSASGVTTPSSVMWQTRDSGIATVSADGVLTGVAVGTTFVSATADGLFAQNVVTVQSPTGPPGNAITACGTITAAGSYVLVQDVIGNSTCVSVTSVADVHLDCQGHLISGLALTNLNGASIQGCTVTTRMQMSNVSGVTVSRSTVQNDLTIAKSSSVVVSDSTLNPTLNGVSLTSDSGVQLLRDTVATTKAVYGVILTDGMNNQVLQSTFTGGYSGVGNTGADDAVILINETGDTIQGNTINGFYDTAIEGVDVVSNTTIANNTASNLGYTGIGSFWCTSWTANVIRGNHISNAPTLAYFDYRTQDIHCGSSFPEAAFTNNQFIGNVFRDRKPNANGASLEIIVPGAVSGNLIQGNDFGSYDGPFLSPLSGYIDGGDNVCGATNPAVSNFPCTGGGS